MRLAKRCHGQRPRVISKHPKVVGIGEAGSTIIIIIALATFRPRASAFTSPLARESGLPIVIHSREAEKEYGEHT